MASFTYDANGNMKTNTGKGVENIGYDTRNLPLSMSLDNDLQAIYRYNSEGWRTLKKVEDNGTTSVEEHYIMDDGTVLAVTDANGNIKHWNLYGNGLIARLEDTGTKKYYVRDHLGSTRQVVNGSGTQLEYYDYYPFGLVLRSNVSGQETKETFTGKEQDPATGYYYFGSRYYDAALAGWGTTDPAGQFASPYVYAGNPVMYIDPNGEFVVPILVAAGIGALTSGAVYTTTAAITGNKWNLGDFAKSAAIGAVSGAISGGIGQAFAGTAFGQSTGFGILSNSAGMTSTNVIFGNDITAGTIIGGAAGGLVGGALPSFSGVKGGALANIAAEVGISSAKGAVTGSISGGIAAALDGGNIGRGFGRGAYYGAIGGAGVAATNILTMGAAYKTSYDFGGPKPVNRRGTFLTRGLTDLFSPGKGASGSGIALGRNLLTHRYRGDSQPIQRANTELILHETYHFYQQRELGLGRFYSRTFREYSAFGRSNAYDIPLTLEWEADNFVDLILQRGW